MRHTSMRPASLLTSAAFAIGSCSALSLGALGTIGATSLMFSTPAGAVICFSGGTPPGPQGNDNGIGTNVACGVGANANGVNSIAVGSSASANGGGAIGIGVTSTATGTYSVAVGNTATAAERSTAIGGSAT